jgi:hypothetical protein
MQVVVVVPLGTEYPQILTAELVVMVVVDLVVTLVQGVLKKVLDYLTLAAAVVAETAVALHQAVQELSLLDIQLKEK